MAKMLCSLHKELAATLNYDKKILCNLHKEQAPNHGLKITTIHMVFKLEQEKWLKTYIDINIKLKTKAKNKTN